MQRMKAISPDFIIAALAATILTRCYDERRTPQETPQQAEFRNNAAFVGLREESLTDTPPARIERMEVIPMPYIHRLPTKQEQEANPIRA